jgi:hypothetical protein
MASQVVEIARQEGDEFRSVHLSLEDDGTIKLDAQDMGPTVTEFWGDDDYEFWVRVPPASLPQAGLRAAAREVRGPGGRGRCISGLVHDAWHPT